MQRFDSITDISPEYREAILDASSGNPFIAPSWFLLFERYLLESKERPRYYLLLDTDKKPQAFLALKLSGAGKRQADKLRPLSNFYSGHYDLLTFPGTAPSAAIDGVLSSLSAVEGRCWQLELKPLLRNSPTWAPLDLGLRRYGWYTEPYFCHGNWILPSAEGGFEAYWERRPSRLKNTFRRRRNRMQTDLGYDVEIVQCAGARLELGLKAFTRLYSLSWKRKEPHPQFIAEWCRELAGEGRLRLGILFAGAHIVAAQIWAVSGSKAYIFKLAHDPGFNHYSPGTLLTHALMEHVLDIDRVHEVDFLTGDDSYKQDWMTLRREQWGIRAYRINSLRGALATLSCRLRKGFRKRLKHG
nr:GNAT family N-acetyltransferase [Motiliproteus sp. SC1-56]